MIMALNVEVVVRSNTSALTAAPHLLLVKAENQEDVTDIGTMSVNAVVDAALHLEVVTADCRDINVIMRRFAVMGCAVEITGGLDKDNMKSCKTTARTVRVTVAVTVNTAHQHQANQVKNHHGNATKGSTLQQEGTHRTG